MQREKKRIIWLLPSFGKGSGGIRTVLQNFDYLCKNGYDCDLCITGEQSDGNIEKIILKDYGVKIRSKILTDQDDINGYDMIIATYYATVKKAFKTDCPHKIYFMQDYEPWFFPMSINYLDAEDSYRYGLKGVAIGKWLAKKIHREFDMQTQYFHFCADLEVYHPLNNIRKEKAVCFVFQPEKPRRMIELGLKALQYVQQDCPDVKIYLFGSEVKQPHNLYAEHLGVISPTECNELYNKCDVGLCLSATNPSRIPFEMMAAGLPVVEVYGNNTIHDLPDAGCLLSERTPESLATAIITLLKNAQYRDELARAGQSFMKDYPLEKGFEEFGKAIDACFDERFGVVIDDGGVRYNKNKLKSDRVFDKINDVYFTDVGSKLFLKKQVANLKHIRIKYK